MSTVRPDDPSPRPPGTDSAAPSAKPPPPLPGRDGALRPPRPEAKRGFAVTRVLVLLLTVGWVLGLARALTWRPAPPPSPTPFVELARTNLVHTSGRWCQTGHTNPYTGVLLDFYPNGLPMSRSVISNGLLEGLSEGWFTNRQTQIREYYRTNVADGLRTKWYPNGRKLSEATIVLGQIQGTFRRWHQNGVLAEEIPMRDGQPEGVGRVYFESGCLKAEIELRAGREIHRTSYNEGERAAERVRLPQ